MKDTKTNCTPCGQSSGSKTNDTVKTTGASAPHHTSGKTTKEPVGKAAGYGHAAGAAKTGTAAKKKQ